jgi:hypothetical protein
VGRESLVKTSRRLSVTSRFIRPIPKYSYFMHITLSQQLLLPPYTCQNGPPGSEVRSGPLGREFQVVFVSLVVDHASLSLLYNKFDRTLLYTRTLGMELPH